MERIRRKERRARPRGRWPLLVLACVALIAAAGGAWWNARNQEMPVRTPDTAEILMEHAAEEVSRIAVTLRLGEGWSAVQPSPGCLALEDDPDFPVDARRAASILEAARMVSCEAVLTDDPELYAGHLSDFGLEHPRLVAQLAYTDGSEVTLRVGDAVAGEGVSWYYMTVDGDDRLFAVDQGTIDDLTVDRARLYPVEQPTLHQARFDRMELLGPGGAVIGAWALEGDIGNADAGDRWRLTEPVAYPADAQAMAGLKNNLANLRLGAYVGPATEENLRRYGFDEPRLTIAIHQAAGSIGGVNEEGTYTVTDWPEDTFTLTVGGAKNEDVDYVRYEDGIYISSHYLLQVFMTLDALDTLNRYVVPTALGNLASLTIEQGEETTEYVLTRRERVTANNELETDAEGAPVYDVTVERNGQEMTYAALEAMYNRLITVTVSGRLPAGWTTDEPPHTRLIFHDVSGDSHVVALTAFDALHDAVFLDGEAVFYLIHGGLSMEDTPDMANKDE